MFFCIFIVSLCQWGILFYTFRYNIHKLYLLHILNCCNDIYMIPMDCLYMFLSVHILQFGIKYMYVHLKSSFNVFWYKMYTRICIVRNLHIITFEGEGIFIHFQKITFRSKKKGGGAACWTTTDMFQADVTCSCSYEGSCRQLGSWTAGSCTFYSELVQSVEAQHRATFLHEKKPKQIK